MATASLKTKVGPGRSRAQDIDRYVGARMRERRIMLGLTQQQMAELIGRIVRGRPELEEAAE